MSSKAASPQITLISKIQSCSGACRCVCNRFYTTSDQATGEHLFGRLITKHWSFFSTMIVSKVLWYSPMNLFSFIFSHIFGLSWIHANENILEVTFMLCWPQLNLASKCWKEDKAKICIQFSMSRFTPPALSSVADPKMLRDQQRGSEAYSQHDKFLPWWVTTWKPTGENGSKLKEKEFSFSYSAKIVLQVVFCTY